MCLCIFLQGTYVLQDNKFIMLTQLSNGKQYLDQAPKVSAHQYIFYIIVCVGGSVIHHKLLTKLLIVVSVLPSTWPFHVVW